MLHPLSMSGKGKSRRQNIGFVWKAMRPHHWAKNLLLLVPLITSHTIGALDIHNAIAIVVAMISFSLTASAGYILNDIFDIHFDRHHPRKSLRPIARGQITPAVGGVWFAVLLVAGAIASTSLPVNFALSLLVYLSTSLAYSWFAKRLAIVDVLLLAALYTLRVIAGGNVVGIQVSPWLLAFSMFQFLSLAFLKRYAELPSGSADTMDHSPTGRGYSPADRQMIGTSGMIAGYVAVVVFALYINSEDASRLYNNPRILWLVSPVLLYWIQRAWLLTYRGVNIGDPVVFAIKDWSSYVLGAIGGFMLWLASY